jgi:hypothetical protein
MRKVPQSEVLQGRAQLSASISGLPAIPPITVYLLPLKACWGCGAQATVSIRPLALRFHRFYCHSCVRVGR